ncbi:hypothetical protein MAHJHV61_36080 [Mycobacterium avium subsp. hominissuis]
MSAAEPPPPGPLPPAKVITKTMLTTISTAAPAPNVTNKGLRLRRGGGPNGPGPAGPYAGGAAPNPALTPCAGPGPGPWGVGCHG